MTFCSVGFRRAPLDLAARPPKILENIYGATVTAVTVGKMAAAGEAEGLPDGCEEAERGVFIQRSWREKQGGKCRPYLFLFFFAIRSVLRNYSIIIFLRLGLYTIIN